MKNLKKLDRTNMKMINGGNFDDCQIDADCLSVCGVCVTLRTGQKTCMILHESDNCPH